MFVDFPRDATSDRLPELVRYKLRLDSDKVDSTRYIEDRLPRPGPRRRPGIDLKYLYYGFAYLQVTKIFTESIFELGFITMLFL